MSDSLSYLTTLYSGISGGGSALLNAIYGTGSSGSASSTTDPVAALQAAERNQTQDVKVTASSSAVKSAIAQFTAAVNSAKSVKQLLANPAVMNVLLTANGMSDQIGYTALATQALTSNLSSSTSLVNQLSDTRWKTLAETYNFNVNGLKSIQTPAAIASVAQAYAQQTWETSQDTISPGISNALSFQKTASSITSVDQILGDPTMRSVVTVALGIPPQIAYQDLGAQEHAISSQVDIKKFQDPAFVTSFVQRYMVANAQNNASSSSATDLTSLAVQYGANLG